VRDLGSLCAVAVVRLTGGGEAQVPTIARDAPLRIRSPLCESLRWRAIMSCSRLIRGCTVGAGG
jgi:hypothetical protein